MTLSSAHGPLLAGRPPGDVAFLPVPNTLYLPLTSRRLHFSDLCVRDGQTVRLGEVLARDPAHGGLPLLAPRAGTANLTAVAGHVTLKIDPSSTTGTFEFEQTVGDSEDADGAAGGDLAVLCRLGAWQFLSDIRTGGIADPLHPPQALVVMVAAFDSFVPQPESLLDQRAAAFGRGIGVLRSLFPEPDCRIHLVVGESESTAAVEQAIREIECQKDITVHRVPSVYPYGNAQLAVQTFKLASSSRDRVWTTGIEGVLAIDCALTARQPYLERTIAIGGPAIETPRHVRAVIGYPLTELLAPVAPDDSQRIINGGLMTGIDLASGQCGLDVECMGLTVLNKPPAREFLGFVRPGRFRQSFSRCFLEVLFPRSPGALSTLLGGEQRACVACGHCEQICPAGLLPQVLHRYLYNDQVDDAQALGLEQCVECGLCSYVCPCKIELREQFASAKQQLRSDDDDAAMATASADAATI